MPVFTIETTYRLPVYRQRSYEAETFEAACALAIADEGWDDEKSDVETSGDIYVTGVWDGRNAAYSGTALPIPSQFGEQVRRKADHFEVLLGLLKVFAHIPDTGPHDDLFWRRRLEGAIAKAEAILAGAPDPEGSGGVMTKQAKAEPRRVVFQYLVPVHVEVEDGLVSRVTVIDESPIADPTVVEGDATYLADAFAAADDGQAWPSWQFGY